MLNGVLCRKRHKKKTAIPSTRPFRTKVAVVEGIKLELEHIHRDRKARIFQHCQRFLAAPHHPEPGPTILQSLRHAVQERHLWWQQRRKQRKQSPPVTCMHTLNQFTLRRVNEGREKG